MMSSYMTKLEFLLEPYILFRIGKLPHICCLFCVEFSQALLMPCERFVMLLKSRSRTNHPNMHYSYTRGRHNNMPSVQIHPKIFYSQTRRKHQKYALQDIHQINAPSSCCYLSKVLLQSKETWGYAKVIHKKRKKEKKWTSVRDIENNGYSDACLKKKRKTRDE